MNGSDKPKNSERRRATVKAIAVTALPILILAGVFSMFSDNTLDRTDDEFANAREQSSLAYSEGEFSVPQAAMGDFDRGRQVPSHSSEADFWYQARTGSDRYFTPRGDAALAILGSTASPELGQVKQALRARPLTQLDVNDMSPGLWIAVRTSDGNFAAYSIKSPAGISPGNLRLHYRLWQQSEMASAVSD